MIMLNLNSLRPFCGKDYQLPSCYLYHTRAEYIKEIERLRDIIGNAYMTTHEREVDEVLKDGLRS